MRVRHYLRVRKRSDLILEPIVSKFSEKLKFSRTGEDADFAYLYVDGDQRIVNDFESTMNGKYVSFDVLFRSESAIREAKEAIIAADKILFKLQGISFESSPKLSYIRGLIEDLLTNFDAE